MIFEPVREVDDIAKNILEKRYFKNGEKTWEELSKRVIDHVWYKFPEDKQDAQDMLGNRYFIPNSPTLVNSAQKNGGLIACFVVDFPDTIEGIYKTKLDFALIAKKGGGCGTSLTKLRPENSPVGGSTHGFSGGPVKFFNTICHDMEAMTQSGFRSMAMMGTMSVYHPDIKKFITSKTIEGVMATSNISVTVDDEFMMKVEKGEKYWTKFKGIKYEELDAREIFDMIVEGAWKNGEPGLIFYTRVNDSPYKYSYQEIVATNPCFSYESNILTENGYEQIGSLDGKSVRIVDANGDVQNGVVFKSGNKNSIKIKLSNKQEIVCTPDHILKTIAGEVEAQNSKGIQLYPYLKYKKLDNEFVLFGFMQGDGGLGRLKSKEHLGVEINIGKNDRDILNLLEGYEYTTGDRRAYISDIKEKLINLGFSSNQLPEREFPSSYDAWNKNQKASFLRGCFSANGCINSYARVTYKNTCKNFILKLQDTLEKDFEISSYITTNKSHNITFSNGEYLVKESYDLNISQYESKIKFNNEINFYQNYKIEKLANQLIETAPYVTSIKENGVIDVYDFSIPELHWGVVNGFVVHNCGEQGLPPNGCCNLGSVDLSKFFKNGKLDYNLLERAIRLSIRFLDQVIDVNEYPNEEIKHWAENNRPVGCGTMGLADLFLLEKIAYGSKESLQYIDNVYSFIKRISEDESEKLGEEFGIPDACKHLPIPRRNITVNTVAPTGSISLLAGAQGSGCEPIFSEFTTRKDQTGTYQIYHPDYELPYFRCAVASNGAQEVTWKEHVLVQTQIQKYIDSGVSKTINFPNRTRRDTIGDAFIMAWKLGAKGVTVYRNGSREIEVLSPKNLKNDNCPVCGAPLIKESGCSHCTECDFQACEIS